MIDGVVIKPLKVFKDERGQLMHMMRSDDPLFKGFGEIYFSVVKAGVVKGWKRHQRMVQSFAVPQGMLKLVIYDDRAGSSSKGKVQEIVFGDKQYQLVQVPPLVWYSFTAAEGDFAMIANCASIPHDPQETEQKDLNDPAIPYHWEKDQA